MELPLRVDLSHPIADGQRVYPHLPAARVFDVVSREASRERYAEGTSFHIGGCELVGNLGTWIDAPFHRFEEGVDVAGLALERLTDLPVVVVRAEAGRRRVDARALEGVPLAGRAVLVETGWSARFGTPAYAEDHPFLDASVAERLLEAGAALVGVDSINVDDPGDGARPVHTLLLGAGVPIVEGLTNLAALPDEGARLFAVPAPVRGLGSFPVRAFALAPRPAV